MAYVVWYKTSAVFDIWELYCDMDKYSNTTVLYEM